jgi:hypothetical protein
VFDLLWQAAARIGPSREYCCAYPVLIIGSGGLTPADTNARYFRTFSLALALAARSFGIGRPALSVFWGNSGALLITYRE